MSAANIATSAVTTYAYDVSGQRIKLATATLTTYYPSQNYNASYLTPNTQDPTSIVKHVFANGVDIATVQGTGNNAKIYYTATDSLNSSSVMTDSAGAIVETMDYFPFGAIRLDTHPSAGSGPSAFNEQRKYIGQEFDPDTGLNYLNARYYNSAIGRFTSQDPRFWNFDSAWLADPQNQNAYSYARNNPITLSDPSGLIPTTKEAAIMANQIYQNGHEGSNLIGCWNFNSLLDSAGTGMKMGVYLRTQNDARQSVPLEYTLVSKGTNPKSINDWKNDAGQIFNSSPDLGSAVSQAGDFAKNHPQNEITFVGHSKGGPEAEAAALVNNKNAILFNPAPLNASTYKDKISGYTAQINEYIVNGEFINSTLGHFASSFGSHDNVAYLPSQHSTSLSQFYNIVSNSVQNHSMSSVISALKQAGYK